MKKLFLILTMVFCSTVVFSQTPTPTQVPPTPSAKDRVFTREGETGVFYKIRIEKDVEFNSIAKGEVGSSTVAGVSDPDYFSTDILREILLNLFNRDKAAEAYESGGAESIINIEWSGDDEHPLVLVKKDDIEIYPVIIAGDIDSVTLYFSTPPGKFQILVVESDYSQTITGRTITHNLGTQNIMWIVYNSNHKRVFMNSKIVDNNTIELGSSYPSGGYISIIKLDYIIPSENIKIDNIDHNLNSKNIFANITSSASKESVFAGKLFDSLNDFDVNYGETQPAAKFNIGYRSYGRYVIAIDNDKTYLRLDTTNNNLLSGTVGNVNVKFDGYSGTFTNVYSENTYGNISNATVADFTWFGPNLTLDTILEAFYIRSTTTTHDYDSSYFRLDLTNNSSLSNGTLGKTGINFLGTSITANTVYSNNIFGNISNATVTDFTRFGSNLALDTILEAFYIRSATSDLSTTYLKLDTTNNSSLTGTVGNTNVKMVGSQATYTNVYSNNIFGNISNATVTDFTRFGSNQPLDTILEAFYIRSTTTTNDYNSTYLRLNLSNNASLGPGTLGNSGVNFSGGSYVGTAGTFTNVYSNNIFGNISNATVTDFTRFGSNLALDTILEAFYIRSTTSTNDYNSTYLRLDTTNNSSLTGTVGNTNVKFIGSSGSFTNVYSNNIFGNISNATVTDFTRFGSNQPLDTILEAFYIRSTTTTADHDSSYLRLNLTNNASLGPGTLGNSGIAFTGATVNSTTYTIDTTQLRMFKNSDGINFESYSNLRLSALGDALITSTTSIKFDNFVGDKLKLYDKYTIGISPNTMEFYSDRDFHFNDDGTSDLFKINGDTGDAISKGYLQSGSTISAETYYKFNSNTTGDKIKFYSDSYKIGIASMIMDFTADKYFRWNSDTNSSAATLDGDTGNLSLQGDLQLDTHYVTGAKGIQMVPWTTLNNVPMNTIILYYTY